ncbi:toxic anion resistance protein [Bacillus sp. FJAT-45350]|uniref:toxic anion resistance protein n=1 Tax=Bacillus sp. FJAT-45350 TaxID=2011014 RepID=UPI000BB8FFF7
MNQFKQENKMDDFLESVSGLGEDVQKDAGESLEALKKPVQEMMSNKNSSLPTQLHQLKEVVADLEPNYLKDGNVKKFINRLFRRNPIQQYAQKYKTVESQVDQIVEGLLSGKDRLQEDSLMLKELKVVARQRITALEEQMEIGHALNDMLEKEMTEEQWRDNPAQIQKGQQKVISRIKNMSQAVMVLQQSIASVDLIIENNEKLEEAIFNAITMTKNIITVTASIQLALGNQQKVIRAVKNVNEATESMLLSNAQMLKQNSEDTLKTLEEPAIAVDAFKKAYEDVFSAIQLTEQSNERIITSGKKFIEEMDTLNKEMKTKLLS